MGRLFTEVPTHIIALFIYHLAESLALWGREQIPQGATMDFLTLVSGMLLGVLGTYSVQWVTRIVRALRALEGGARRAPARRIR